MILKREKTHPVLLLLRLSRRACEGIARYCEQVQRR